MTTDEVYYGRLLKTAAEELLSVVDILRIKHLNMLTDTETRLMINAVNAAGDIYNHFLQKNTEGFK